MAWPSEAGFLGPIQAARSVSREKHKPKSRIFAPLFLVPLVRVIASARRASPARRVLRSRIINEAAFRGDFYGTLRGKYRIFNAAAYRFYRSNSAPPAEGDSPFDTNATLPHTPADTYANGTWWLSMSYFNGLLDSGFLPLGNAGETYQRLDIAAGDETDSPPNAPTDIRLKPAAGGVVKVLANYYQSGDLRAEEFAIAYTVDGSAPPTDTPDITVAIDDSGFAVLAYDLPAQVHGTTVKVRLQMRRDDGTWIYSEDSTVLTTTADATGPAAPPAAESWPGLLPEDL